MKIFSKLHSIVASIEAAVFPPTDSKGKPLSKTLIIQHPPGTLLDVPDDVADDLIAKGQAVEFNPDEHEEKDGQVTIARLQAVAPPLPEGFTQPVVVRQDETLNDGTTGPGAPAGPVIVRDTKNDAAVEADKDRAAAANAARAGAATTATDTK